MKLNSSGFTTPCFYISNKKYNKRVRSVIFSENFAYVLDGGCLTALSGLFNNYSVKNEPNLRFSRKRAYKSNDTDITLMASYTLIH